MPFARPTLQEIIDRIETDFKNRIENADSFLRRSVLKVMSRVFAGVVHLVYGFLQYQKDQLFLSTADTDNIELQAAEFGIRKTAAVSATGSGTVTGTTGKVIPAGTKLSSPTDNVYLVDTSVTLAAGTGTLAFTAEVAGADSNDTAGITLSFITPITGVNTSVTVSSAGITGGTDEETPDSLRDRGLTRKRQPPHGGAEFDYENWALEVSGVTRAWSFPQYMGDGTIGLAFVRDNDTNPIPNATQRAAVRSYIVSHDDPLSGVQVGIPVTAEPGLFIIDNSLQAVAFSIAITPNTATVQADVTSKLSDLILTHGGPGETIYLSEMQAAIAGSTLETAHTIISPAADVAIPINRVGTLGTIVWSNY
jgi:uncharacterized phage protein gp47/JayE